MTFSSSTRPGTIELVLRDFTEDWPWQITYTISQRSLLRAGRMNLSKRRYRRWRGKVVAQLREMRRNG